MSMAFESKVLDGPEEIEITKIYATEIQAFLLEPMSSKLCHWTGRKKNISSLSCLEPSICLVTVGVWDVCTYSWEQLQGNGRMKDTMIMLDQELPFKKADSFETCTYRWTWLAQQSDFVEG